MLAKFTIMLPKIKATFICVALYSSQPTLQICYKLILENMKNTAPPIPRIVLETPTYT